MGGGSFGRDVWLVVAVVLRGGGGLRGVFPVCQAVRGAQWDVFVGLGGWCGLITGLSGGCGRGGAGGVVVEWGCGLRVRGVLVWWWFFSNRRWFNIG